MECSSYYVSGLGDILMYIVNTLRIYRFMIHGTLENVAEYALEYIKWQYFIN